ncbi:MAG: ATP-binding cassette domain-containing protein [Pirellulaceae bacterium]
MQAIHPWCWKSTSCRCRGLDIPVRRLRNISFQLRRGEIVGIAGLMGAGRTELLESLFGASPVAHQGRILLDGQPCRFGHPSQAMAAGIAMVTEDRKRLGLFSTMNVRENISLCALQSLSSRGVLLGGREPRGRSAASPPACSEIRRHRCIDQ